MNIQYDIFGNEITAKDAYNEEHSKPIKSNQKKTNGKTTEKRCGECRFIYKCTIEEKIFYKCNLIGNNGSDASDIGLKDIACGKFEERQ